jgi:tight adherence protein B
MATQLVSVLAALMIFGALALLAIGYQRSRARAATPDMETRLDRYGGSIEPESTESGARATSAVTERIDRAVKGKSFAEKVQIAISRADLRMTVGEFLALRIGSALGGFTLGLLIGARAAVGLALVFGILLAIFGWALPSLYLSFRAGRRKKAFVNQLGDTIGLMANSLRAGYSLLQTMELVSREAPSPMSDEFRRVVREVGLGLSPQHALNNMLRRIPSEDLDLMVSAINIQHEIGGNLGQILDVIGETIRERVRIQGEIQVLTAQQQLSGNIITAMPVFLAFILFLLNPEYMNGILVWPWICIPIGASVLVVIGYFVMRKIIAIEV